MVYMTGGLLVNVGHIFVTMDHLGTKQSDPHFRWNRLDWSRGSMAQNLKNGGCTKTTI